MTLSGPEWGSDEPSKLVIFLHGWGASGDDLIALAPVFADKGLSNVRFLAPNAPFPCSANPLGREWFDLSALTQEKISVGSRAAWPCVEHYIEQQSKRFGLEYTNIGLVGFSQGTIVALSVAFHLDQSLNCVVGFSGLLAQDLKQTAGIASTETPILLVHGAADEVVPAQGSIDAAKRLHQFGYSIKHIILPNIGHTIDPQGIDAAGEFLKLHF